MGKYPFWPGLAYKLKTMSFAEKVLTFWAYFDETNFLNGSG